MFFWQKKKPSYERAMDWFKQNMVAGQGIIVHTNQPAPYPEVTGYFIPTLYNWGEKELARTCTKWAAVDPVQGNDIALPAEPRQYLECQRNRQRCCRKQNRLRAGLSRLLRLGR